MAWDLKSELKAVAAKLEQDHLHYAVCGGMAVGMYCEPRGTVDLDLVVEPDELGKIISSLREIGYESFSAVMNFKGGEIIIHRVIKMLPDQEQVLMLDLCIPDKSKFPEVWQNWRQLDYHGSKIVAISRVGLIAMKKGRGSDQDIIDIRHLEEIA